MAIFIIPRPMRAKGFVAKYVYEDDWGGAAVWVCAIRPVLNDNVLITSASLRVFFIVSSLGFVTIKASGYKI
jgi:hypothetical protein